MRNAPVVRSVPLRVCALIALAASVACVSGPASAGCAPMWPTEPAFQTERVPASGGFMNTAYREAEEEAGASVAPKGRFGVPAAIVGTWRFTWTSDGSAHPAPIPAGVVVDFGTQQWHGDGTEFIISGARPPGSGDACMGSWVQTGPLTYRFKHIGLSWATADSVPPATPAVYVGPAIIRATVTLNQERNAFAGTFTLDQLAKDESTLLQHIGGTVSGTRFSVD